MFHVLLAVFPALYHSASFNYNIIKVVNTKNYFVLKQLLHMGKKPIIAKRFTIKYSNLLPSPQFARSNHF